MSLKSKIVLMVLTVVSLYAFLGVAVNRFVIFPSFLAIEKEAAEKGIGRCLEALEREIHHLDLFCYDWSAWDDTYQFVEDGNEDYVEANLIYETFSGNDLNLLYIVNAQGEVVWGKYYDLNVGEPVDIAEFPSLSLPPTHPLLQGASGEDAIKGVMLTEVGPLLVSSRPILTSTDQGPPRGRLIMGRLLDSSHVETMAQQTGESLTLQPVAAASPTLPDGQAWASMAGGEPYYVDSSNAEVLRIYAVYPDVSGSPALLLRVEAPRDITGEGRRALSFASISNMVAGLAVLVVTLTLLQHMILGPLDKLTAHIMAIGASADLSIQLDLERTDEIGILAREFNGMVRKLREFRKRLLEQSYRIGMAEMAAGTLHDIRNALTPLNLYIESARESLAEAPVEKLLQAREELEKGDPPPDRKEALNRFVYLSVDRLATAIQEASSMLAEIQGQRVRIESILAKHEKMTRAAPLLERTDLNELVQEAITRSRKELAHKAVVVDESVAEVGAVNVQALTLLQVLRHLLVATATLVPCADEGKIEVKAALSDAESGASLHLWVGDGSGNLTNGELAQLFERERLGDNEGLYPNLHWCASAIAALGGRVYPDSDLGADMWFHVILPNG